LLSYRAATAADLDLLAEWNLEIMERLPQ